MNAKAEIDSSIFRMLGVLVLMAYGSFVVMVLWNWFVAPLGAPSINMAHALGIGTLASMLQYTPISENHRSSEYMMVLAIKYTMCLVFGALVQMWV